MCHGRALNFYAGFVIFITFSLISLRLLILKYIRRKIYRITRKDINGTYKQTDGNTFALTATRSNKNYASLNNFPLQVPFMYLLKLPFESLKPNLPRTNDNVHSRKVP